MEGLNSLSSGKPKIGLLCVFSANIKGQDAFLLGFLKDADTIQEIYSETYYGKTGYSVIGNQLGLL